MYCYNCGKENLPEAIACVGCGVAIKNSNEVHGKQVSPNDAKSFGYGLLGFLFPLIGLIMFLVWKEEFPLRAKSAGKGALISVIINVVITILAFFILLILALSSPEGFMSSF